MNILAQPHHADSKDIKFSDKKVLDLKLSKDENFFENLISEIVSKESLSKNREFLLSKLLNLSSEFEKKESVVSYFSKGELFTDNQISQVSIEDLFNLALLIKKGEDITAFKTDSKELTLSLLKGDIQEEFKSAKNIKDLLAVAKKHGIEVKNFQFFQEEAALDIDDKRVVKKIKSEDIFKLIERQFDIKVDKNRATLNSPKETIKQNSNKPTILQAILSQNSIENENINSAIKLDEESEIENRDSTVKTKIFKSKILDKDKITVENENRDTKLKDRLQSESISKSKKVLKEIKRSDPTKIETDILYSRQHVGSTEQKDSSKSLQEVKIDHQQITQKREHNILLDSSKVVLSTQKTKEINQESQMSQTFDQIDIDEVDQKQPINHELRAQSSDKIKIKQSINSTFYNFAQEFKEQVESYKPPLMKIKMELKPSGLGEVDVTLINRGNTLQVNINSNPSTIAMFAQNQVEFKNSLVNMGFSDLQMNFGGQNKRQQEQQSGKNSKSGFEYFSESEEQDSFEITIPKYI